MSWRRVIARLTALVVLAVLLFLAYPYLRHVTRVVQLLRQPAPSWLPVPVEGVEPGDLGDTWGASRSGGRTHEGIDIFAPRGTPVASATRGIVVRKGWNRLGGRTVSVLGPGGRYHYYAHLDEWDAPEPGDWVEAGTVLGYVGDSGNAAGTPTHLHYGIYGGGEALNPYPLLTAEPDTPSAAP
ncbi:MAG TPA: M23 family metallopeptidase [Thermoanaerobaculia bacterium]|nr:M23 family metallopeptidase [Thermoanaerobaculia bacterium]